MNCSIYVASPLGFTETGKYFYYEKLLPMIAQMGFEILDPWVLTEPSLISYANDAPEGAARRRRFEEVNEIIGRNNALAIRSCSLLVAILDGSDVDSGTAAEIGNAAGLGKRIIGYRNDFRLSSDNVGSVVNLQVEYFIREHGGSIASSLDLLEETLKQEWHIRNHLSE